MTAYNIQTALDRYFDKAKYNVSNVYFFKCPKFGECDFLSIAQNEYIHSVEIKVSIADYKKDFTHKPIKHLALSEPNKAAGDLPNKFYYACPKDLIKVEDIPSYAGLIYVEEYAPEMYSVQLVKTPPFLHKNKIEYSQRLCSKLYYGYKESKILKQGSEYKNLRRKINQLTKELENVNKLKQDTTIAYYEVLSELRQLKKLATQ